MTETTERVEFLCDTCNTNGSVTTNSVGAIVVSPCDCVRKGNN